MMARRPLHPTPTSSAPESPPGSDDPKLSASQTAIAAALSSMPSGNGQGVPPTDGQAEDSLASPLGTAEHPSTGQLDADEEEYRRMRRDIPHVAGAAAVGLLALGVSKTPDKNDFFRTKKNFCPIVDMVSVVAGMEHKFFVVDKDMLDPLASIGIRTAPHVLYLTITTQGVLRVIPVR